MELKIIWKEEKEEYVVKVYEKIEKRNKKN
jgi:hypothetical protein